MAEHVAAIVFWSKNNTPLIPYLNELDKRGYNMVFHFTITELPGIFEKNFPPAQQTLDEFKFLAKRYPPEQVLRIELVGGMVDVALQHGVELYSCCNEFLLNSKIKRSAIMTRIFSRTCFGGCSWILIILCKKDLKYNDLSEQHIGICYYSYL